MVSARLLLNPVAVTKTSISIIAVLALLKKKKKKNLKKKNINTNTTTTRRSISGIMMSNSSSGVSHWQWLRLLQACFGWVRRPMSTAAATKVLMAATPFVKVYLPQVSGFVGFGAADDSDYESKITLVDEQDEEEEAPPPSSSSSSSRLSAQLISSSGGTTGGGGGAAARRRRRALLIGINYNNNPKAKLGGCVNDTTFMKYCLQKNFQYKDFVMMNEDSQDPKMVPTRANILREMRALVANCQDGDHLFFHYSGHGAQEPCASAGEELDGMNETILPVDFETSGTIHDDEIYQVLIDPLPRGVKMHLIFDSCHSGTISDLPYAAILPTQAAGNGKFRWMLCQPKDMEIRKIAGEAVCFSGCEESQTSADTSLLSGGVTRTGACTYAFVQAVEENAKQPSHAQMSYGHLLARMREVIESANERARGSSSTTTTNNNLQTTNPLLQGLQQIYGAYIEAEQQHQGGRASGTTGGLNSMLMSAMISLANGSSSSPLLTQKPQVCASHAFNLATRPLDL
ncbi:metacaspase [Pseudoscourfieldia marina]